MINNSYIIVLDNKQCDELFAKDYSIIDYRINNTTIILQHNTYYWLYNEIEAVTISDTDIDGILNKINRIK